MSTIKLKRSGTTGSVPGPDDLVQGELAINYADNKLYALSHDNVTVVDLLAVGDQVGVATFNGLSGDVFGVGSFNGLTGDIQGVSAWNGSTGAVVFNDYVATFNGLTGAIQGVSAWNGLTGNVDITNSLVQVGGLSAGSGATFAGLVKLIGGLSADAGATFAGSVNFKGGISADSGATFAGAINTTTGTSDLNALKTGALLINDNYNFPTGAGATGDVLMIADDGDLEFEPLRMSANFVVDSDIPLATGVRYKALYAVPMQKMAVTNIDLRSHDVSPAGSGDSLQVALKTIRRFSDLEAASPSIQTTVETVAIALGGEYHSQVTGVSVDNPDVGSVNSASYLVVDVVSNAGNHTNFCMTVTMEARP